MEDIRAVTAEPAVKFEPTAGIGKALAHVEGEKRDLLRTEGSCRGASGAGESDHGDLPAASPQALGQEDGLLFRSADAVEGGNDQGKVAQRACSESAWSITA